MSLSITSNENIGRVFDYWSELRAGGQVPSISEFDPLRVHDLLANIWLAAWSDSEEDFVYRIAGEAILNTHNRAMHNRPLHAIYDMPMSGYLRDRFLRVSTEPCAYHARGTVYLRLDRLGSGERLILPMVDRDRTTPMVLGCTVYSFLSDRKQLPDDLLDGKSEVRSFLCLDGSVISSDRADTVAGFI